MGWCFDLQGEVEGCLAEAKLTCGWVTALARIWPGSMLAAASATRVGSVAGGVLLLCARYLALLQAVHEFNKTVQALYQQQSQQQQSQQSQQQQSQQQQQQLMQKPADDITAAVVHTASLLLVDLGKHVELELEQPTDAYTCPHAVHVLLSQPDVLQDLVLPVLSLYGNQLQLHLLHTVQQQMQQGGLQQQQQQSVPGVPGQRATTGDGSSSRTPADEAEEVLLCRADMLQSEQLHQLPDSPAAVQSWQQHFPSSTLPHHLLLTTASAVATAADTSTHGQGYSYVQPPHCWVDAAKCTAAFPDAAGSSSSSSGNEALVDVSTCVAVVAAAARLLRIRLSQDDWRSDPAQVCQHHPGLVTAPLLLLSSAVATLRLAPAEQALRAAVACAKSAALLADPHHRVVGSPASGSSRQPGAGTAGDAVAHMLAGLAWPAAGLATLLARQVICVVDAAVAADAGSGGSSDERAAANTPPAPPAAGAAEAGAAGSAMMLPLQLSALMAAAMGMEATLSVAVALASGSRRLPSTISAHKSQMQQASFMVQVIKAAARCHARLLASPGGGSGAAAAAAAAVDVRLSRQHMLLACSSIMQHALTLACAIKDPTSSRAAAVERLKGQQVVQACMSEQLSALSTPQHPPGAAVISGLEVCTQLLVFVPPAVPVVLPSSKQLPACLFLLGRCLLGLAAEVRRCVLDPGRHTLRDWAHASAACKGIAVDEHDSKRLVTELTDLLDNIMHMVDMLHLRHIVQTVAHAGAQDLLHAVQGLGWGRDREHTGSDMQSVLTWMTGAVNDAVKAQRSLPPELMQAYHFVTHLSVVRRSVRESVEPHLRVLRQNTQSVIEVQQEQQQELSPVVHKVLCGLHIGLSAAGGELCAALPNRFFCNNPACSAVAGVSAGFGLVRGERVVCAGCLDLQCSSSWRHKDGVPEGALAARYCSVACQQQHLECHRGCYHHVLRGRRRNGQIGLNTRILLAPTINACPCSGEWQ